MGFKLGLLVIQEFMDFVGGSDCVQTRDFFGEKGIFLLIYVCLFVFFSVFEYMHNFVFLSLFSKQILKSVSSDFDGEV